LNTPSRRETVCSIYAEEPQRVVNFFMNKFKKLGFIDYDGDPNAGIQIRSSLLGFVDDIPLA
jgi:hypothetical protein